MSHSYFQSLFNDLGNRSVEATLGTLGIKSAALRNHLRQQLTYELQAGNRILGDPVFDPVFPWTTSSVTFQQLADQHILRPSLVKALNDEHKSVPFDDRKLNLAGQALKGHYKPYTHQLRAWETLAAPDRKSIVVTSGTGSGKTECFMIPILNDLVGQAEQAGAGPLVGVQALFIYPLNALINSQRERLLAWTYPYKQQVRFCLYNGNTPPLLGQAIINGRPGSEVYDRRSLWKSPPPMLVTNPTMLEYMLIRNQDRPILEKSQGKLKYIVLDEAHTYIGSQAAELALLIRRALNGFGVTADDVRFIATSATIGSDQQAQSNLKKYLADLAGISPDRVEVIDGQRNIPILPPNANPNQLTVSDLCALPDADRRAAVYENETARRLRNVLIQDQIPKQLTDIANRLFGQITNPLARQQEALAWLDLASQRDLKQDDVHFLPLRGHFFHKVLHGLWACVDRYCPEKRKPGVHLNDPAWGFGYVYTQQRLSCTCGAPVYELVFCNECNTGHLKARLDGDRLRQNGLSEADDFLFDLEQPDTDNPTTELVLQTSSVMLSQQHHDNYDLKHLGVDGIIMSGQVQNTKPIYWSQAEELCAACDFSGQGQQGVFRGAYLGMPFYTSSLVPTLLEHIPDGKEPITKPMRGRNLLTFTDSRQGTARIAVKMQQNAERLRIRGLVYQKIQKNSQTDEIKKLQTSIQSLLPMANVNSAIAEVIQEKETKLAQLCKNTISWTDLVQALSLDEDVRHIHRYYHHELDPDVFDSALTMAKVLLAREFGRRPKRGNSLETLGLTAVYYEGLDAVTSAPIEWQDQQLTVEQWRDFLKICLDFYVREGFYLDISDRWLNWLGVRVTLKYLLSPNSTEGNGRNYIPWAAYRRKAGKRQQSRIIRFLAKVLGFDLENMTKFQIGRLDALMEQAWHALTHTTQILQTDDGGRFQLRLEKLQFRAIINAWQCPITLRVLDTTLNGLTPYLPVRPMPGTQQAVPLKLPTMPRMYADSQTERLLEVRKWLQTDPAISKLRDSAIWTNLNDSIAEGGAFYRTAEHSAQQSPAKLQRYEAMFKDGTVNVLSCSTTMEMGVDIGGLTIICNNNVPPHPANYLQRAGRAGRRGESRSLSLTLCKNNPLDQQVFRNPLWPFTAMIKQPNIILNSERIVQRHLNAWLFGYFINHKIRVAGNAITLMCNWFFSPVDEHPSVYEQMNVWLDELPENQPNEIQEALNSIRRNSILQDQPMNELCNAASICLETIAQRWLAESKSLETEHEQAGLNQNDPYRKRIEFDLKRHREEYLLTELITGSFLPGYGFPTDIATFNPMTAASFRRQQNANTEHREDNRSQRKNKPSRDMSVALSEYAPGAEIVLDGRVYISNGITLNWHNPDDNVRETQLLQTAWRCQKCGMTGIESSLFTGHCTGCGKPLLNIDGKPKSSLAFIEPTGFTTSFYGTVTNNVSQQKYLPVQLPWINTTTAVIMSLPNAALGSYKSDERGQIFYHNSGEYGQGFAICLDCGYANSMKDDTLPANFNQHDKLRGKKLTQEKTCHPDPNRVQKNLYLGHVIHTDVFELYLKQPETNQFLMTANPQHEELCWSVGVALRHGLTQTLGINTEEIGVQVKQVKNEQLDSQPLYAICLYDTNGGGSGFASQAPHFLSELFASARKLLVCPAKCGNACETCLLQFDTQKVSDKLNRHTALAFLTDAYLSQLGLQPDEQLLGTGSKYCVYDLKKALSFWRAEPGDTLQLIVGGDIADWNIGESTLQKRIGEYINKFAGVEIWLNKAQLDDLDTDHKRDLYSLLSVSNTGRLLVWQEPIDVPNGALIATIVNNGKNRVAYATNYPEALTFSEEWSETDGKLLVRSADFSPLLTGFLVDKQTLLPAPDVNLAEMVLSNELNGPVAGFGAKFWLCVQQEAAGLLADFKNEAVCSMAYTDRYLATPFNTILFAELVKAMPFAIDNGCLLRMNLLQSEITPSRPGNRWVKTGWQLSEDKSREKLIEHLLETDTLDCAVDMHQHKRELHHARIMVLSFDSGRKLTFRFDQGVGYWELDNRLPAFPFNDLPENQHRWISQYKNQMRVRNGLPQPTYVFIRKK